MEGKYDSVQCEFLLLNKYLYVYGYVAYTSLYHMHAWCPCRLEEANCSSRSELADVSEPSCGCSQSNLSPLEKQSVILNAEPSLKAPNFHF